jgi:hypothetical protein
MNASMPPQHSRPGAGRSRIPARIVWLSIAGLAAGVLVWGFLAGNAERVREAERERPVEAPLRVASVGGEPTVTLTEDEITRAGVEVIELEETEYPVQLKAYGTTLDLAPLVELSNGYASARAELQTARARLTASRTAAERARRLYDDQQNMSLAELQTAQAAFEVDQANVAAGEATVENLASTARQQWGAELGRALVGRTQELLRLLEMDEVLVQVTLPPGESLDQPPEAATARITDTMSAALRYVSRAPRTDPRIQGVSFFYTAAAEGALLPGMSVTVLLDAGETISGAVVPADSVVWTQDRAWAYFRSGERSFARREVPVDRPAVGGGYFVAGLTDAVYVVRQGAQLLLSEEFRSQIQVGEE